ncbi:4'-phosphopantetheinyl transferase family protein [Clostridium beijerinckii]|uniref:4'-phosphopantetheinyl transferase family protein n=1 Tax=Clostridium beijerinckii TaxID=1520 RepID=UPI00098C6C78|nr:4'-phosphopantetheinyl transferase superfamily protein [Clostridium beijerinckii]NRT80599.1 4'-phosphopantetheinyl transferase [Clostridium beijerinckii]OOM47520.1 4'-phosphopantetheinyl transferase sfp [Clostridium beijerinckii]
MAYIYILEINEFSKKRICENVQLLSLERQIKINKYKFLKDSYRSFISGLLVRYAICTILNCKNKDLIFDSTLYGKPFVKVQGKEIVHFNLSHSGKYVVCAIDNYECGIDVECSDNFDVETAKNIFHYHEVMQLNKCINDEEKYKYLNFLWTMKEAYVKAIGVGLSKSLSSFYVDKKDKNVSIVDSDKESIIFNVAKNIEIDEKYSMSFVGNSAEIIFFRLNDIQLLDNIKDLYKYKKYYGII